jgi:recombination protein RecR
MSEPMPTPPVDPIAQLNQLLARLPGIGERTAQRLTFFILRAPPGYARDLSESIGRVVREVRLCSRCCTLTPQDPCAICADTRRDDRVLCVVESVQDQLAVERTREFKGRYHVLHGALSPLDGVGPDQLKVQELLGQLQSGVVEEVILATNPTVEGEATALYLSRLLKPFGLRLSRIAQGVPMGGDLEYADQVTLARALVGRREF